jgi:signal peptidase II
VRSKYFHFGVWAAVALLADQLTKVWARAALRPRDMPLDVIAGIFDLRYSENTGIAFGLLRNAPHARWFLAVIGLGALGAVWYALRRTAPEARRLAAGLGLVTGGAIGNLFDRVAYGRVTDFVHWGYQGHAWPNFNVADAALVVGIVLLTLLAPRSPAPPQPA